MRHLKGIAAALIGTLLASTTLCAAEVKVGVIQSQTGPAAFLGVAAANGIRVAIDVINARKMAGENVTLVADIADDASDRGQSISLFERYARDPKVLAVLGPSTGAIAGATAQAANQLSMPMYTLTNLNAVVKAGPWSFMGTQPGQVAIPNLANFAVEKLGVKKCAVTELLDNESYILQRKIFSELVAAKGVAITSVSSIKLSDTDYSAAATRIASEGVDCVFLAVPAAAGANFVLQLRQAGLDPKAKIVGMTVLAADEFIKVGGKAVEGTYVLTDWVPGGSNEEGKAFYDAFKAKYKVEPDIWAAVGYTLATVFANAVKSAGDNPTRESVKAAMTATKDVPVIIGTGKYSFELDTRIPLYGNSILTVKNGAFVQAP
ncbi:MAG: ABC transporter substrate-binding protein [Chelatococcus sp.]|jgi:branched-chain amino acid transport system substrate-binding protein|uniref:ABC transporter substrate-binding protein n=1 Tax=Chelatococcus sp. TaxID=1953771 RepID=UPI0025B7CA00|nr:ABC transporter substrate-binding protein [Chelatococcus sp.]MBX3539379.1 ABC transporter substrate-binding protein [Chelatococcus sp.]